MNLLPVRVIGPKDKCQGVDFINTTTRSTTWSNGLSPMLIGPVPIYNGMDSCNMENAWQYSKVYSQHADYKQDPTPAYWKWAKEGWRKKWADRYPVGKGIKPLYSYWNGDKLDYVQARKTIYGPLYSAAVQVTDAYMKLTEIYKDKCSKGEQLVLWDFDGYDHLALGRTLKDVINDNRRKMGHAFILAHMLQTLTV